MSNQMAPEKGKRDKKWKTKVNVHIEDEIAEAKRR